MRRLLRPVGGIACAVLVSLATQARADIGDVLRARTFPGRIFSDLALAPDGTLWVLEETDGNVYPLLGDLSDAGAPVPHPIGPSQIPTFQPRARGIAFDPRGDGGAGSLWVLDGSAHVIWEMALAGDALRGPIEVQSPQGADAGLYGLALDADAGTIWTLDGPADLSVEMDPAAGTTVSSFRLPGDDPPETMIFGEGIAFLREGGSPSVWVPTGTIFDGRPVRVREIRGSEPTGVEIPLDAVEGFVRGVALGEDGGRRVAYLVAAGGGDTAIVEVDAERPLVPAPTDLACVPAEDGTVGLAWTNHGSGPGGAYGSIRIRRNGEAVATLAGDLQAYADTPDPGPVRYEIEAVQSGRLSRPAACATRVGRGAVLRWAPFAGTRIHDLAIDAERGEIWVTDSVGNRVYRYTMGLERVDDQPGPFATGATGIAFVAEGDGGEGSLIVGNPSNALLQERARDGTRIGGAFPAQLASPGGKVDGIATVVPAAEPQPRRFAVVDGANGEVDFIDGYGNRIRACRPPSTSGVVPRLGITYSPVTDTLYLATAGGGIVEIDRNCAPTGLVLEPDLPGSTEDADRIRGIAILGNKFYVCGGVSNALFEVLIAPVGTAFVRGDATGDGEANLSDAVAVVRYLFLAGPPPGCLDAADANDDGRIDISDPTFLLFHLFLGGDAPPAPWPGPGVDPTFFDPFTCEAS